MSEKFVSNFENNKNTFLLDEKKVEAKVESTNERKDLAKSVEDYKSIDSLEKLELLPNNEIVDFVLKRPDDAFQFFFKPTGNANEWKVDFGKVDWRLLGLGHFKAITQKFNQVSVNGNIGSLNINASRNKPGYSNNQTGNYLSINNGSVVQGIEADAFEVHDLITEFTADAKIKNGNYVKALKENPNFFEKYSLKPFVESLDIDDLKFEFKSQKFILERALDAVKNSKILGAKHCTDWVSKIIGQNADAGQTLYNSVSRFGKGFRVPKPADLSVINNVKPGDYLMAENGNSTAGTHGMIALENFGDGRVKVASWGGSPKYGPKIEVYDFNSGLDPFTTKKTNIGDRVGVLGRIKRHSFVSDTEFTNTLVT